MSNDPDMWQSRLAPAWRRALIVAGCVLAVWAALFGIAAWVMISLLLRHAR
jgi:hypothetical protein